ncbi:hypothetical protein MMC17_005996 [Xylographa soralifera]|nr:hypothetical protein [Xylographa soralifera]
MPEAYASPQYPGQPPSGYQDNRPYYFSTTVASSEISYRIAPSYPSSLSGSYSSAQEPYPPPGGGRSDPRYTNQGYGSYPPRSLPRGQSKRYVKGYELNSWGDFPDDASNASAPRYNDSGYNREGDYPAGSSMKSQYESYKAVDDTASHANRAYKDAEKRLKAPDDKESWDGQAYGKKSGRYHYPEDHETLHGLAYEAASSTRSHGDARTKFNHDHIGRVTQKSYKGHAEAATNAYTSERNNTGFATYHDGRRSKERYP